MHSKGLFIVVEGIDGSGKSLLTHNLTQALEKRGQKVLLTKEPGGSTLGKNLRSILQTQEEVLNPKAEFLLFAADRAQHFEHVIIPALKTGTWVISDRCSDSSLAYQGYGRGLGVDMITAVNKWVMQDTKPDVVFYLKVDVITALNRIHERKLDLTAFEKNTTDFWERVIQGFETIFKNRLNVVTLDGCKSPEIILADVLEVIDSIK